MLCFVHSFMLGESSSEKTYTKNGVIQGAVISVTLFLVALADIVRQVQHPVEIIGYADDWVIHTSDQDMDIAQANIQAALNNLSSWIRRKGFKISPENITCACEWTSTRNKEHPQNT
jgi:hypothetical protein